MILRHFLQSDSQSVIARNILLHRTPGTDERYRPQIIERQLGIPAAFGWPTPDIGLAEIG